MSWDIRTKKSAELFSIFLYPRCLALPIRQNNQKPTPKQREHFRYYSCLYSFSRQTF